MTALRFTPYAWAKLIYMRDKGSTEVAGYGISSIADPLLVTDFMLVKQESSSATFEFDDKGFADYVDDMIDLEMQPAEFQRILIHTHPCNSATPSTIDEKNFKDKFSDCDWAIMFILAHGGDTTCALKYKHPECRVILNNFVDFHEEFGEARHKEWDAEYKSCIKKKTYPINKVKTRKSKKEKHKGPLVGNHLITGSKSLPVKTKNPMYMAFQEDGAYGTEKEIDWMSEEPDDLVDIFNRGNDYPHGSY